MTRLAPILALAVALVACAGRETAAIAPPPSGPVAASASAAPLAPPSPCLGRFVAHTLDATTAVRGEAVRLFDSNGAGLALGDLDGDGRLDIALANLDGPNRILWNQGGLRFRAQDLDDTSSRAAAIVDVDGDGMLDITFSHRAAGVSYWRGQGGGRLARQPLPGVSAPAYAMAWGDVAGDAALDLVAGSYDAELSQRLGGAFLFSGGAGVFVYTRAGDGFRAERLAATSQALAIALPDLDGDGRRDIWVGNDFEMPDAAWLRDGGGWRAALPASATSENTMSLDLGDVDNDGDQEIFATDMKPMTRDPATLAAWLPMMQAMARPLTSSDPQRPENTLLARGAGGLWHDHAYERGVDASGWSWSGKFGDLDQDGLLDLYVVNGMIAAELFPHLPNGELVEPNAAYQNAGGRFRMRHEWGLGSTLSGRGMSMGDLDGDGDLDIVVNNLRGPAQLFENRLCGGDALLVELRWPGSGNSRAIGATLALHTSAGTYTRDMRATSGYLSGDPPQAHFGIPRGATVERLEVRWPDGRSTVAPAPRPHTLLTITR